MTVCPIWGDPYPAIIDGNAIFGPYDVVDSPRAGGRYQIAYRAKVLVDQLDDAQKARLTTLMVDERRQGDPCPSLRAVTIDGVRYKSPLSVHQRAERLLHFIIEKSTTIGTSVAIHQYTYAAYAWLESLNSGEVTYLLQYLADNQWVQLDEQECWHTEILPGEEHTISYRPAFVTIAGYSRVEEQTKSVDSSQAFVAMWFDSTMDEVYSHGVKLGITDAGYDSLRIDQKPDVNKIDDEIIAEIRRSRFLVADFTYGDNGARGGVYYEAGFAHGLGLPVIFSCRNDIINNLHFDTRQYHHIVWETPAELREGLRNRILALIGAGPGEESTVT